MLLFLFQLLTVPALLSRRSAFLNNTKRDDFLKNSIDKVVSVTLRIKPKVLRADCISD